METKFYDFKSVHDYRGSLSIVEGGQTIPFDIKRVYYIYNNKSNSKRGFHAHKELLQVVVCVHGSCKFILDDGSERTEVLLDDPTTGLFINNMIWREMYDFSDDCVLVVFASEHYDLNDYIMDYDEFMELI